MKSGEILKKHGFLYSQGKPLPDLITNVIARLLRPL